MADHLLLVEGNHLMPRPQLTVPAQGTHVVWMLQPHWGLGLDKWLLPRGTPLGLPLQPPRGVLMCGAFGSHRPSSPFCLCCCHHQPASSTHLQPRVTLYPSPETAHTPPLPAPWEAPLGLQPVPGGPALPPPPPTHALVCMERELIHEEALTSLELEPGLHPVRELPKLFLGQSQFNCFSDFGLAPPTGSVSC